MVVFFFAFIPFIILSISIYKLGNKSNYKYNNVFNFITIIMLAILFISTGVGLEFEGVHALTKVPEAYLLINLVLSVVLIFLIGLIKLIFKNRTLTKDSGNSFD